jgi:hypothetical protein
VYFLLLPSRGVSQVVQKFALNGISNHFSLFEGHWAIFLSQFSSVTGYNF